MSQEVISLLLTNQDPSEQNGKSLEKRLSETQSSAVVNRILILLNHLSQPNRWRLWWSRFSKKFQQNLAELEALLQYGNSQAVWEIAHLNRKKAAEKLSRFENRKLVYLTLFSDCPSVERITLLKLKEEFEDISAPEQRELTQLQRNLYPNASIPHQLLELLWPHPQNRHQDWQLLN